MNKENFQEKNLKYYTYTLNMTILNILSLVLFLIVALLVILIEHNDIKLYTPTIPMFTLFILMFIWLVIHELLHALGFSLNKSVNKKNITFGIALEKGVFYCMCKQNITKKVILISLLFPVTIIGIITLIIGMIINNYELVFLSVINIVSSIGDIAMTIYFLKCPNDIIYLDLDDCTSFTVLSSKDLNNIKVPGIKLKEQGQYNKKTMFAKDKRRLVISNPSYPLLILILILIIISIII